MAIIIPSKNIYDKHNPKVIDNVIDRLEIGEKRVQKKEENNVSVFTYESNINAKDFVDEEKSESFLSLHVYTGASLNPDYKYIFSTEVVLKYINVNISFSEAQSEKLISKVYEPSENGISYNIDYQRTYYDTDKFEFVKEDLQGQIAEEPSMISLELTHSVHQGTNQVISQTGDVAFSGNNVTLKSSLRNKSNTKSAELKYGDGKYLLNLKILAYKYLRKYWSEAQPTESARSEYWEESIANKIVLDINGDLYTIDISDETLILGNENGVNSFSIDGNELLQPTNFVRETSNLIEGIDYTIKESDKTDVIASKTVTLTNTYESSVYVKYLDEDGIEKTKAINQGDQEVAITYDPRGSIEILSVYALETTYPSQENYEKILNEYKDGKETATILCSIGDYYDWDNCTEKRISPYSLNVYLPTVKKHSDKVNYVSPQQIDITVIDNFNSVTWDITIGERLQFLSYETSLNRHYVAFSKTRDISIIHIECNTYDIVGNEEIAEIDFDISGLIDGEYCFSFDIQLSAGILTLSKFQVNRGNVPSQYEIYCHPMFQNYDEVIPMICGNDGKDTPMSLYKNGSAKIFKVLGTHIYYDGAVWQELSLQEKYIEGLKKYTQDLIYVFEEADDKYSVYGYSGTTELADLVIPAYMTANRIRKPVGRIEDAAFQGRNTIVSVNIGDGVTDIGDEAFESCANIVNVELGKKVENIGYGAFHDCSSLKSITIPKSVVQVGENAFLNCDSLTDVYYRGTEEEWAKISIRITGNDPLKNATIHYNS